MTACKSMKAKYGRRKLRENKSIRKHTCDMRSSQEILGFWRQRGRYEQIGARKLRTHSLFVMEQKAGRHPKRGMTAYHGILKSLH